MPDRVATRAAEWTCRSEDCRFPLGEVREGTLVLYVKAESVDRSGLTRVPCPKCGRVKVWFPTKERATSSSDSR
jgi:hypothetical protein